MTGNDTINYFDYLGLKKKDSDGMAFDSWKQNITEEDSGDKERLAVIVQSCVQSELTGWVMSGYYYTTENNCCFRYYMLARWRKAITVNEERYRQSKYLTVRGGGSERAELLDSMLSTGGDIKTMFDPGLPTEPSDLAENTVGVFAKATRLGTRLSDVRRFIVTKKWSEDTMEVRYQREPGLKRDKSTKVRVSKSFVLIRDYRFFDMDRIDNKRNATFEFKDGGEHCLLILNIM